MKERNIYSQFIAKKLNNPHPSGVFDMVIDERVKLGMSETPIQDALARKTIEHPTTEELIGNPRPSMEMPAVQTEPQSENILTVLRKNLARYLHKFDAVEQTTPKPIADLKRETLIMPQVRSTQVNELPTVNSGKAGNVKLRERFSTRTGIKTRIEESNSK